jgi:hypothetical protein
MILKHRRICGTVIALVVAAAAAAPSASARVGEEFLGPQPAHPGGGAPAATKVRVVEVPAGTGFDWGDAGIGAGAALATIGLGGGLLLSNRRHREARSSRTA